MKITCEWGVKNKYYQNYDGQVSPCCYLVNSTTEMRARGQTQQQEVLIEYNENMEELNIFNNSIDEILSHKWFTKTLPESWNNPDLGLDTSRPNPKVLRQCAKHCGVKEK